MNASRRVYSVVVALAVPLASLVVFWRGWRERTYWQGWPERFGLGEPMPGRGRSIWLHAVSVGEVQAASTLVAELRTRWPELPVVISCGTPAGRERARALGSDGLHVRYAPYDLASCVRGALRRLRPALLVIMETELWPNLLAVCEEAGVQVLVASARLSARSARRFSWFPNLLRPALQGNVTAATQSTEDQQRFEGLGMSPERTPVCGNLKFDRTPSAALRAEGAQLRARYAPGRFMWVAGSTHAGEEQAVLAAHETLRRAGMQALLVLAPRHRPRFETVAALLSSTGMHWARRSASQPDDGRPLEVLLLDTLGELEAFYAAADLAFVGGSLVPIGGHSLLEPTALGVPTIAGPHQENAPEVARQLLAAGALQIVTQDAALARVVLELARDEAARRQLSQAALSAVAANRGALECILTLIKARLAPPA